MMAKDKNEEGRKRYESLVVLGLCTTCGNQPATEGGTRCIDCDEIRKKKFFAPRTDENRVANTIDPKQRKELIFAKLAESKVLYKSIGSNLYVTSKGYKFMTASITFFKDAVIKGRMYRIRNESKIKSNFIIGYCPDNEQFYVIPVKGQFHTLYFPLDEIEEHRNNFKALYK